MIEASDEAKSEKTGKIKKILKKILRLGIGGLILFILYEQGYLYPLYRIVDIIKLQAHYYEFHCDKESGRCITEITYCPPSIADHVCITYLVYGKKRYRMPLNVNYIDMGPEVKVLVKWQSKNKCIVYTDDIPLNYTKLAGDLDIEFIEDYELVHGLRK